MNPDSIWYLYDPESIGWLHRRHKDGEPITFEDVVRLLEADPANLLDPIMQSYALAALKGGLRPPKGRKPHGFWHDVRLRVAAEWLPQRAAEIRAERKLGGREKYRAEGDPGEQAADEIGHELFLPRGRTLINAISALKKRDEKMKASAAEA